MNSRGNGDDWTMERLKLRGCRDDSIVTGLPPRHENFSSDHTNPYKKLIWHRVYNLSSGEMETGGSPV